jgi:hypothetical protein
MPILLKNHNMKIRIGLLLFLIIPCVFLTNCTANTLKVNQVDTVTLNSHDLYIDHVSESQYNIVLHSAKNKYDKNSIKKTENKLMLPLSNGMIILTDSLPDSDDVGQITYKYVGFLKEISYYIIMAKYYETGEYIAVNYNNGNKTKIWGLPKVSPDNKHLVVTSSNLYYDIMPNGIQMWEIMETGELKLNWEYQPKDWEPRNAEWASNNDIYILKVTPHGSNNQELKEYIRIRSFSLELLKKP